MTISSTTWSILYFTKQSDKSLSYETLREMLKPIYHDDMKYSDVVSILMKSLTEIMNEPRFKIHYGQGFLSQVMIEPLKKNNEQLTIVEVYDIMVIEILYGFRYAISDWCVEELEKIGKVNIPK